MRAGIVVSVTPEDRRRRNMQRHRPQEFIRFLNQVESEVPARKMDAQAVVEAARAAVPIRGAAPRRAHAVAPGDKAGVQLGQVLGPE